MTCTKLQNAKFSSGLPVLPAYNFLATVASSTSNYRLGLWSP